MDQIIRKCQQKGHDGFQIIYICIHPICQLPRLLCSECVSDDIHRHQEQNNKHLLTQKKLYEKIQEDIYQLKMTQFEEKKDCQCFMSNFKLLILEIQQQLKLITNIIKKFDESAILSDEQQLNELLTWSNDQNFYKLNDEMIEKLLSIEKYPFNKQNQYQIKQSTMKISETSNNMQKWADALINNELQKQIIKSAKYRIIDVDYIQQNEINSAQISNDLKYIASGGTDMILKLWSYETCLLIKQEYLEKGINIIKFTDDSSLIYVGIGGGKLLQFTILNLELKYSHQIHQQGILNIICLNNNVVITCSADKQIIKTNIETNEQLFRICAHNERIDGLDYDRLGNWLASCSDDKSIKIWNGTSGKLILEKQNAHDEKICQIQMIPKYNKLLSLDILKNLKIWEFDKQKFSLNYLRKINDESGILNFSVIIDFKYVVIVSRQHVKIFLLNGEQIRSIQHNIIEFRIYSTVQLPNMDGIIVKGKKQLNLIKLDLY